MQPTISIPKNWEYPRFTFSDRIQQGIIVGMEYYVKDSFLADKYDNGWRYSVTPHKNSDELLHYHEEQIQQLSPEKLQAQTIAEIGEHQQQIDVLMQQLADVKGSRTDG